MSRPPALQFYVRDFLAEPKLAGRSCEFIGAYCLVLFCMWDYSDEQCVLPLDTDLLAGVWRTTPKRAERLIAELSEGRRAVLEARRSKEGPVLYSKRLDEQAASCREFRAGRSAAGQKGAAKRWHGSAIAEPKLGDGKAIANDSSALALASIKPGLPRGNGRAAPASAKTADKGPKKVGDLAADALAKARKAGSDG